MSVYYRLKYLSDKERVAQNLLDLRRSLRSHIRALRSGEARSESLDSDRFLRLATWNIREFGANKKFGKRRDESLYYIAEILSHFDLIAVQEVNRDTTDFSKVTRILGSNWDFIATDVTEGTSGNEERMAFVFNRNKVWFRDFAGELVLPKTDRIKYPYEERLRFSDGLSLQLPDGSSLQSPDGVETYRYRGKLRLNEEVAIDLPTGTWLQLPEGSQIVLPRAKEIELTSNGRVVLPEGSQVQLDKDDMAKLPRRSIVGDLLQFARTPYLVSFQAGWLKLNLCTVHIYYGKGKEGLERRKDEILGLTEFLANRAKAEMHLDKESFFIALGDFNIMDREHETMQALLTNGFSVPEKLQSLPGSNVAKDHFYDQIAYWQPDPQDTALKKAYSRLEVMAAGVYDFYNILYREGSADPDGENEAYYSQFLQPGWDYREWRTYQMSDHLPMWVELCMDFGDEYLKSVRGQA